jgi:hypothetical protein
LSPFFNQTVSARRDVDARETARHNKVLVSISKYIGSVSGKSGTVLKKDNVKAIEDRRGHRMHRP